MWCYLYAVTWSDRRTIISFCAVMFSRFIINPKTKYTVSSMATRARSKVSSQIMGCSKCQDDECAELPAEVGAAGSETGAA